MKSGAMDLRAIATACALGVLALSSIAHAQPAAGTRGEEKLIEDLERLARRTEVDRAIDAGLDFLRAAQRVDGSFGGESPVALTSLAALAFIACGHTPVAATPEGKALVGAIEYLLADGRQRADGYFGTDGSASSKGSRMYGHGLAVLLLAEVLGTTGDEARERRILAACRKGIELILASQAREKALEHAGGWRYEPDDPESDLSVTVWILMALRAAQNAGLEVSARAIDRAVAYVKRRFEPRKGGFTYRPGQSESLSMTAAGIVSLRVCGVSEGRELDAAADFLLADVDTHARSGWGRAWFYYATYYVVQAAHQLGGRHEERATERVVPALLAKQTTRGAWETPPSGQETQAGEVYTTAMAVLTLAVGYRWLPIYQR